MPVVSVSFYVKKLVSGDCVDVTTSQTIVLFAPGGNTAIHTLTTDDSGYKRARIDTGQYDAEVNGGCRELIQVPPTSVTLCNTCAN